MAPSFSAPRAQRQWVDRALLRRALEADWAGTSCGAVTAGAGVGVGAKRKMGDEGGGRGKRVRMEESREDGSEG